MLERFDDRLERFVILVRSLLDTQHDVAIHLNEAAIAVPGKARVVRLLRQRFDRLIVQPEVQNRVHHARHRIARTGTDGHEQRIFQIAELLLRLALDGRDASLHLTLQRGGIGALVIVVIRAHLSRDREPGRHGQPDAAHLGEICPLAAEQRLHRSVAICLLPELEHVLARCLRLRRGLRSGALLRSSLFSRGLLRHSNSLSPSTPSRSRKCLQCPGSVRAAWRRGRAAPHAGARPRPSPARHRKTSPPAAAAPRFQ